LIDLLKTVCKHCATGIDGETYDVGRIIGLVWGIGYVALVGGSAIAGKSISLQDVGIGAGAIATGIGALLKLKENSEPKA
jgi:hypothetical protein